jgi:hypothetical protein
LKWKKNNMIFLINFGEKMYSISRNISCGTVKITVKATYSILVQMVFVLNSVSLVRDKSFSMKIGLTFCQKFKTTFLSERVLLFSVLVRYNHNNRISPPSHSFFWVGCTIRLNTQFVAPGRGSTIVDEKAKICVSWQPFSPSSLFVFLAFHRHG